MSRAGDGQRPGRPLVVDQTITVYRAIIDEVIANMKPEFVQEEVDESVLEALRETWEAKILACGSVGARPAERPAGVGSTLGDGAEGQAGARKRKFQGGVEIPGPMPGPPMHPDSVFVQQVPGAAFVGAPQHRGVPPHPGALPHPYGALGGMGFPGAGLPGVAPVGHLPGVVPQLPPGMGVARPTYAPGPAHPPPSVPQRDGAGDDGDARIEPEEAGSPGGGAQSGGPPPDGAAATTTGGDASSAPTPPIPAESDEELNEADDLNEIDDSESVDAAGIKDRILGQFDKVQRTKARWKVQLRDCVLQLNGRDYLLHRANGEFNF